MAKKNSDVEEVVEEVAEEGIENIAEGLDTIEAASDVGMASRLALAAGASDVTRGVDAQVVADRAAVLSDAVAVAGVVVTKKAHWV